jgi:hypothetical protein
VSHLKTARARPGPFTTLRTRKNKNCLRRALRGRRCGSFMKNRSTSLSSNQQSPFANREKAKLCLDYDTVFRDAILWVGIGSASDLSVTRLLKRGLGHYALTSCGLAATERACGRAPLLTCGLRIRAGLRLRSGLAAGSPYLRAGYGRVRATDTFRLRTRAGMRHLWAGREAN